MTHAILILHVADEGSDEPQRRVLIQVRDIEFIEETKHGCSIRLKTSDDFADDACIDVAESFDEIVGLWEKLP